MKRSTVFRTAASAALCLSLTTGAVMPKQALAWDWLSAGLALFQVGAEYAYINKQVSYLDNNGRDKYMGQIKDKYGVNTDPAANAMLGRQYGFCLPIIHGQQLGRQLGFPTLNQRMPVGLIKPRFGVYASVVTAEGQRYRGVTNIGRKPTVGSDTVTIETWMPDYHGRELYEEVIDVRLYHFIRPEQRFDSLTALRHAVEQDAEQVMTMPYDTQNGTEGSAGVW